MEGRGQPVRRLLLQSRCDMPVQTGRQVLGKVSISRDQGGSMVGRSGAREPVGPAAVGSMLSLGMSHFCKYNKYK